MGLRLEISTSDEWYVLKENSQYGPYSYAEMIHLLQDKTLFSFDFVWSPHMESWHQLGELAEFSADRIAAVAKNNSLAFFRRNFDRAQCHWVAYAHNDQKLWPTKIESVSQGGALLLIENPLFLPGDMITLHVPVSEQVRVAFNAKAEIISKRLTKEKMNHDSQIYYAAKFGQVQSFGLEQIKAYVDLKNQKQKKGDAQ